MKNLCAGKRLSDCPERARFQLHYTATGKPEVDESKLGLYLTDQTPDREYLITGPINSEFEIPPHARSFQASAEQEFDQEITLYSMFPHMHFRGKSMRYEAHLPDGTVEPLLNVPNYNFNWQRAYVLDEPRTLPAGTKVVVHAEFDNSKFNPFNPSPSDTVWFGEQSFDEMLIGFMSFHYGSPDSTTRLLAGDPKIVASIVAQNATGGPD